MLRAVEPERSEEGSVPGPVCASESVRLPSLAGCQCAAAGAAQPELRHWHWHSLSGLSLPVPVSAAGGSVRTACQ